MDSYEDVDFTYGEQPTESKWDQLGLNDKRFNEILKYGWQDPGETWTYSSVDDPTGILTVSGDVTTKYSAGMRIKFTNGGNTIYGIITAVSYSSPNTSITFLHQIDPTDSLALALMANSTITANYYSTQKAPYGFPLEPTKWTVEVCDKQNATQTSPTAGNWYNLGSILLTIPIGLWDLEYQVNAEVVRAATVTTTGVFLVSLSTDNDDSTDTDFTCSSYLTAGSGTFVHWHPCFRHKVVTITSKTAYYLIALANETGVSGIHFRGDGINGSTIIRAKCAYL